MQETEHLKWNEDLDQVQEESIMKMKVELSQNCLMVPLAVMHQGLETAA